MIRFLEDGRKPGQKVDYNYCSERIRELINILNGKYEIKIVGQEEMNERLVMAMVLNEHILLEGLPGTAKTTAIKNLAEEAALYFNRVQFIPDMQPSDLVGKRDLRIAANKEHFETYWMDGPLFTNLLLADELNRASARVQAALLEAMGEKQITPFGQKTKTIRCKEEYDYLRKDHTPPFGGEKIDQFNPSAIQFNVFATMNPIEMEGTFPLSEASVDRYCFKVIVHYPNIETLNMISMKVLQDYNKSFGALASSARKSDEEKERDHLLSLYFLRECRKKIFEKDTDGTFKRIKQDVIDKISHITFFSNYKVTDKHGAQPYCSDPEQLNIRLNMLKKQNIRAKMLLKQDVFRYIESGTGPRGLESLIKTSLCQAFLDGDQLVNENHVKKVIHDVLRHRIRVNIQARTQHIESTDVINELMEIFL